MQRGPQSRVMVEGSALAARRLRPERPRVPTACQGGSERPCSGNGQCSGDGSRQGDGSCQCHVGYRGPLCTDCVDGYFSSLRNETHSICTGAAGVRGRGAAGAATTDGLGAVSLPVPKHAPGRQGHFPPVHPVLVLCGLCGPAQACSAPGASLAGRPPSSALRAVPGCGVGTEAERACCHLGLVSGSEQRLCRGQAHVPGSRRDGEVPQTGLEQPEATRCSLLAPALPAASVGPRGLQCKVLPSPGRETFPRSPR